MKYKVGDKVIIKKNDWVEEGTVKIVHIDARDDHQTYQINGISLETGKPADLWVKNESIIGLANNEEMVNHPKHYQGNGLEAIDVIEAFNLNFNLGNAVKYILRCGKKDNDLQELNKAIWYLERELKNRK